MEFAAAPYAPKHGPGNTHHNTVATPNTLNSACQRVGVNESTKKCPGL